MIGIDAVLPVAFGLLVIYVLVSPRLAERVLYHRSLFNPAKCPDRDYETDKINGVCRQEIEFASANGSKLNGWYFENKGSSKTVLLSHGNAGNLGDMHGLLELLLKSGVSVFAYDYQGFGKSEGSPSIKGMVEDGLAAYDWLVRDKGVNWRNIVLYGESMGGSVSGQIALRRPVDSMILQSVFSCLRDIGIETIPFLALYPEQLFPQPYFDNKYVLREFDRPVLIIHGALDKDVKYSHAEKLYSHGYRQKNLVCLPHTQHEEIAEMDSWRFIDAIKVHLITSADLVQAR